MTEPQRPTERSRAQRRDCGASMHRRLRHAGSQPGPSRATETTTDVRDDRVLATTRWVSAAVVPVLMAAFVILYLFPQRTMLLWGWMVCPSMSALIMGAGYMSGAYFFTRAARGKEWHRVSAGFVATTLFSTLLLATTILHWDSFNHDHVSFWAWLLLYTATPVLLPALWLKNRRTDPRRVVPPDVAVPRSLRVAVGVGGALQLSFAAFMFLRPSVVAPRWPWAIDILTCRSLSAFVAFPAVTWLLFLVDRRWGSFRVTQQTASVGLALITIGALRARGDFITDAWYAFYVSVLILALMLNAVLFVAMERRCRRANVAGASQWQRHDAETPVTHGIVDLDGADGVTVSGLVGSASGIVARS